MKKNIYLAQINYLHGKSTFLPYASGTLIAAARQNNELDNFFSFKSPIFIRESIDTVVAKIEEPYLVGFSNYLWNHEYNKALAKKIKDKYPGCLILFGGHQITPDASLMEKEDYIDLMCFGEGEETFEALLLALKNNILLNSVPNIAYRNGNEVIRTADRKPERIDYPSPYLTGVFDEILPAYPDIDFHTVIETNRGCPYSCAYCDWGNLHCKVRFFSEEKVMKELQWLSDHNIRGFGCADANFGMFERDEKFVDEMVRLHNEEGVLTRFQVSSAKNSNERVFSISKKLNECGMDKGATLSFQSLNESVLENIHRKNIPVSSFSELLKMYNQAGIPTYSELIMGLPGETYNSFVNGIDTLLEAGQHNSIYIHNCEWLPCAEMGSKNYIKKHGIEYIKIPLSEPHTVLNDNEEISEFSRLIVKTNSMSRDDWIKMNIYAATIQCFHHEGLLMMFALYLHYEKGVPFSDFYESFVDFMQKNEETIGGRIFKKLQERLENVVLGNESLVWKDTLFGDVGWSSEEFLFLNIAVDIENFYSETKDFLKDFFDDTEPFESLFTYQKNTVKLPFKDVIEFENDYNFKEYFTQLLCGNDAKLRKIKCKNVIVSPVKCNSWADYARFIIWYGRKDSRNIYLDEIEVTELNEYCQ